MQFYYFKPHYCFMHNYFLKQHFRFMQSYHFMQHLSLSQSKYFEFKVVYYLIVFAVIKWIMFGFRHEIF